MSLAKPPAATASTDVSGSKPTGQEVTRLADLSPEQWKSGAAAWLGWLFDGLDMHLYTIVATPFVAELLGIVNFNQLSKLDKQLVDQRAAIIQAGFLVGWALGGGFFGRLGDRLGRSRALMLTILTYAMFTGLSTFAQTWWHLLIFRFMAALGIGGEWAVGASLLSETWPRKWRPWLAAVLQTGVNIGIIIASVATFLMAGLPNRYVFLVGVLPAFLVLWIRRAVPEPEEWHAARAESGYVAPSVLELFRGQVKRITVLIILVCSFSLTAHWAFSFWSLQQLRELPELATWSASERNQFISQAMFLTMFAAIVGNFAAAALARTFGYRKAIIALCLTYLVSVVIAYGEPRSHQALLFWLFVIGACGGVFALFTMYLPPLFPTLLRTTGAGFCYNIGRIAAAFGTVFFVLVAPVGEKRYAILFAGLLFLPAAAIGLFLPEPPDEKGTVEPVD